MNTIMQYCTYFHIVCILNVVDRKNLRFLHTSQSRSRKAQSLFLRSTGKVYDTTLVNLLVCQVRPLHKEIHISSFSSNQLMYINW